METMASRGILTLAFGKPKFIEMAKALAWSLNLHAPAIPRAIVTDSNDAELAQLFSQRLSRGARLGFFLDRLRGRAFWHQWRSLASQRRNRRISGRRFHPEAF